MARNEENDAFLKTSFLYGANAGYIEELYAKWSNNPTSVSEEWAGLFESLKPADIEAMANADKNSGRPKLEKKTIGQLPQTAN